MDFRLSKLSKEANEIAQADLSKLNEEFRKSSVQNDRQTQMERERERLITIAKAQAHSKVNARKSIQASFLKFPDTPCVSKDTVKAVPVDQLKKLIKKYFAAPMAKALLSGAVNHARDVEFLKSRRLVSNIKGLLTTLDTLNNSELTVEQLSSLNHYSAYLSNQEVRGYREQIQTMINRRESKNLNHITDELLGISESPNVADIRYFKRSKTLHINYNPVALEYDGQTHYIGDSTAIINLDSIASNTDRSEDILRAVTFDGEVNHDLSDEGEHTDLIHPHIYKNSPCWGDGKAAVVQALQRFDLASLNDVIEGILKTYNARSPYLSIGHWSDTSDDAANYVWESVRPESILIRRRRGGGSFDPTKCRSCGVSNTETSLDYSCRLEAGNFCENCILRSPHGDMTSYAKDNAVLFEPLNIICAEEGIGKGEDKEMWFLVDKDTMAIISEYEAPVGCLHYMEQNGYDRNTTGNRKWITEGEREAHAEAIKAYQETYKELLANGSAT